jgi:hypothetical protein
VANPLAAAPTLDVPSTISASAAFIALLFSLFVWFRTRTLQKPTERPIIAVTGGPVILPPRSAPELTRLRVHMETTNTGTHAATEVRTRVGYALQTAPHLFKALYDESFANRIEPQHGFFWEENFEEYFTADAYVYTLITYRDALTGKPYYDENWSKYVMAERAIWHALISDKQRIEEYVRVVYPLPR